VPAPIENVAPLGRRGDGPHLLAGGARHKIGVLEDLQIDEPGFDAGDPQAEQSRRDENPPREDGARYEIPERLAQDRLGSPAPQLETGRDGRSVLDELMIQERHAALDGSRHAHLVLLHQ